MKNIHKLLTILLAMALVLGLLPTAGFAAGSAFAVGNSDLNILNGGTMLSDGDDFYFVDGGIFLERNDEIAPVSADVGGSLNLWDAHIYYTVGAEIRRVPISGGAGERVYTAEGEIKQMYVVNGEMEYLADGCVYKVSSGSALRENAPTDVFGFIPTQYGNIYLTGSALNYTVWAGETKLLTGVQSAYTDSGYLALEIGNENYMVSLPKLFSGFDRDSDLLPFDIHGGEETVRLLSVDEDKFISEYNENNALSCDYKALLMSAGMVPMNEGTEPVSEEPVEPDPVVIPEVSQGQMNMVKRAKQMTGIQWTPLSDRTQWGARGTFTAGTTYTGLPYGQPVNNNGYVGWGVTLDGYMEAVNDNTSKFYSGYSTYNKIAPYYSTDCSGFVSYCWQTDKRRTTYSLPEICEKVGDQSVYSLQVGDIFDHTTSHVVLVTDVLYAADGTVTQIEISEQTPVITKVTRYGDGQAKSLASLQSYYLNGGYAIYRNPNRDSVTYTPNPYISVDGESGAFGLAPKVKLTSFNGGRSITLYNTDGSTIYYTTDGSDPKNGQVYSGGEITSHDSVSVRAVCDGGAELKYTIYVPFADKPKAEVTGTTEGELIASGSKIALSSSSGTTVYYTTDGTEPTENSTKYTSPITVTSDISLKAMAIGAGFRQSETATVSYKLGQVFTIDAAAQSGGKITPSGKTEVFQTRSASYTITPNSGYEIEDVVVDGQSVRAVSTYTFTNVSESHSITASFFLNLSMPFTDVTENDWYYEAVGFAYSRSLFNGTSETTFSPGVTMTRGMFVTVLGRFAGMELGNAALVGLVTGSDVNIRKGPSTDDEIAGVVDDRYTAVEVTDKSGEWYGVKYGDVVGYIRGDLISVYNNAYSDLTAGQFYSPYVQWAQLTGVAKNAANGEFRAEEGISRQDMCLMLNNYATAFGIEMPIVESKTPFSDDAAISETAKIAVYALQQADVVNGTGDGTFNPNGTASRAEVSQIFENYVNALD